MIAVTGATGHLGKLVIEDLLKRGTSAKNIVALVRDKNKAQDLVSKGVEVRVGNYSSVESLEQAFQGVDKLLLVSGNEFGQRTAQHTNVATAAKRAGVKLLAYTSVTKANTSGMYLGKDHFESEKAIQASGVPYVILRNSWYLENYTEQFQNVLASGVIAGAAQDGKISAATRADYAAAAASILLGEGKANTIYELGGASFTLPQLAEEVSKASGKKIEYKNMPAADFAKLLKGFGLPEAMADVLADSDEGIVRGELFTDSQDLENLIHRKPTSLQAAVKTAVSALS